MRGHTRRAMAGAAILAAVIGGAAGAPPASAAGAAKVALDAPAPWFENVASIPGAPLDVAATGPDDVWVAVRTGDGLAMAHYDEYRWQVTPVLPGRDVSGAGDEYRVRPAVLAAVAPDDIWLSAGGGLAHYDGEAWREVAAPTDAAGRALTVTTVAANPGRVLVGTRGADDHGGVWRRTASEWAPLGEPYDMPRATRFIPIEIKLMGRESVMTMFSQSSGVYRKVYPVVWWNDGRSWSPLYQFEPPGMFDWSVQTAWVVRSDWRHLFFGYRGGKGMWTTGTCAYAHRPGMVSGCATGPAVSDAVQRGDRAVVLAVGSWGDDRSWDGRPSPARLVLRQLDGSERIVGQAARFEDSLGLPSSTLAVEPDGRTVWAATPLGLQRLGSH